MLKQMLCVGTGGLAGSVLRYLIDVVLKNSSSQLGLPLGTLTVNLIGCLLIGILYGWIQTHPQQVGTVQLFLGTGILGGFTTYSAFSLNALQLLQSGHFATTLLFVAVHVMFGLFLTTIGFYLATYL